MHARSVRVSVLDEVGDRDAPVGSRSWAIWIVSQAKIRRDGLDFDARLLRDLLIRMRQHEAWKALGLLSFDVLCSTRLGLSSDEVMAFLDAKEGQTVGAVITKTQAIRERRASHPDETQQATANAVGCDKGLVSRVSRGLTESSESEQKVNIPDWIKDHNFQVAFRKLPADERERLEGLPADRRRGAVRAAAVAAGIIRVPSKLQVAQKAFVRLNGDDRLEFISWMMTTQLATEPCA